MGQNTINGRCFCGEIRFFITPPSEMFSHCHCDSCRLSHGAAFVSWTSVPSHQFQFTAGENLLKRYQSESGALWGFCSNCGTSFLYEHESAPGRTYLTVANLLDTLDRPPEGHVSYEERVPWFCPGDDLSKYKGKTEEVIDAGS